MDRPGMWNDRDDNDLSTQAAAASQPASQHTAVANQPVSCSKHGARVVRQDLSFHRCLQISYHEVKISFYIPFRECLPSSRLWEYSKCH